jgi:hypothetical protein
MANYLEGLDIYSLSEVILLQGKKGVWLNLPVERSELVPVAVKVTSGHEYMKFLLLGPYL